LLDPLLYNPHIVALAPGTHLGPYEILEPIGKGGMGEVYRARDTRLGRDVAIKAAGERFTERFDREARAVAALNHSNVCHLYDVGPNFLVMELVEGSTLAERLKGGALPLDEALAISRQIADALDAAHEKGIVHRDLKPGNVMITPDGTVKVLDFGLAKAAEPDLEMSPENSPTLTVRATQAGMILGTAAYMSPEQAAGKKVDKRADIWAFGVVLHETITGKRLFEGDSIAETLAGVIKSAPDLSEVPAQIRPLLDACLEKDPKKRLRDIGDARRLLAVEAVAPSNTRTRPLRWMVATAALATVAIGASLGLWAMSRTTRPTDRPLMRFDVDLGPDAASGWPSSVAISPDGTRLVFPVRNIVSGGRGLPPGFWIKRQSLTCRGPKARGACFCRWIGFFADGKLKKMPVQGGAPIVLCDAPLDHARDIMTRLTLDERSRDAIWTPDGKHLLYWTSSPNNSTISVIRADGAGEPQQLLESKNYVVPSSVSPDGRRLLYFEVHPETRQDLWTLPLDVSDSDHFKPGKPEPFLRTPLLEFEPSFSPDGRCIAYRSNESDANLTEVYVRPYPGPGGKWQVSNGGGKGPIWSRNGKELFYETLDGRIMVVDYVTKGEAFEAGRPRQWSDQRILSLGGAFDADLAFDGRRFVVFPPSENSGADRGAVRVTFLVNFFDELRRRLPLAGR
jgi:serine/threonine protein kinase